MKEILDLIRQEITDAFVACGYDEKYRCLTDLICVSISVMVPWQQQKNIKKHLSQLLLR